MQSARSAGLGRRGYDFFGLLPPITGRAYSEHNTTIAEAVGPVVQKSCKKLAVVYMIFMKELHDQVIDVGVSVDGTWVKRGYLSKYGVSAAIACELGLRNHA